MIPPRCACLFLAAGIAACDAASSTFLGGTRDDKVMDVAVGPKGGVYVAGYTGSADFPQGWLQGGWDSEFEDGSGTSSQADGFVVKLTSDLEDVEAWTFVGGRNVERVYGLAIDDSGNVFVVGQTRSVQGSWEREYRDQFLWPPHDPSDRDPSLPDPFDGEHSPRTIGPPQCVPNPDEPSRINCDGQFDAFVAKFNSNLEELLAWTYLGGNLHDEARDIVLSSDGQTVYVVGSSTCNWVHRTQQEDEFCIGSGLYKKASRGQHSDVPRDDGIFNSDAVLWVLDSNLDLKAYSFLGGRKVEFGYGAAWTGTTGDVFVVGPTRSDDFPYPPDGESAKGGQDVFVARFSDDAKLEAWTLVGGPAWHHSDGAIDVGPSTGVVIAVDAGTGGGASGAHDVWVLQLEESLRHRPTAEIRWLDDTVWELKVSEGYVLGGSGLDQAWDLEVSDRSVWISGFTTSTCFGPRPKQAEDECGTRFGEEVRIKDSQRDREGFLSVVNLPGLTHDRSVLFGSQYMDHLEGVAVDDDGWIYVAGHAAGHWDSEYPTTAGTHDDTHARTCVYRLCPTPDDPQKKCESGNDDGVVARLPPGLSLSAEFNTAPTSPTRTCP